MKKLGNLTLKITENYLSKNSKIEGKLLLNWNKLFINYNEKFKLNRVLFLKNRKNKGMLVLNVKRGFELEIQMETLKILDKVNNFLGYKAIDKIKIKKENF